MIKIFFGALLIEFCIQTNYAQGPPSTKNSYATILQDARNEPTPDGTFGYLYKTEDGIVSSARGGPNGVIQGGFSYTDPTGLKVNINYNAGSRARPSAFEPPSRPSAPSKNYSGTKTSNSANRDESGYYKEPYHDYEDYRDRYVPPQPRYRPSQRRVVSARRGSQNEYPQSRVQPVDNELYDDYN